MEDLKRRGEQRGGLKKARFGRTPDEKRLGININLIKRPKIGTLCRPSLSLGRITL